MTPTIWIFYLAISAFLAWGFVAYAAYRIKKEGVGLWEFSIALLTPLFTTFIVALFQQGDLSIWALFPFRMLSYGGDSLVYLAQTKMIIEFKPESIQYLPGFAALITPLVLLTSVFGGEDLAANIALIIINYLIVFPLIFLLIYRSALHISNKESGVSRILIYVGIYVSVMILYLYIPPGYMISKNVITASHRVLGLVVVYEPFSYFCFALMLYMVTRIINHDISFILGLLVGFSVMVTERSILWSLPLVSYYLLILIRNNLLSRRVLFLILASIVLIVFWYIFYDIVFYNNVLHDSRGSYWLNRCLHWASRMNSLYPGLSSQCPPRLSIEYIPYNFNRLVNDYWVGLIFIFFLIAPINRKSQAWLAASLVLIAFLNVVVFLSYINPQTFVKYNSILIWPIIFSFAILAFQFECLGSLKRVFDKYL